MRKREQDDGVHRITSAPEPLAVDQARRMRSYLLQMGIRLVCIFLAVLVPGPARWLFVVGAVLLPYTAVLMANAGRDRRETTPVMMEQRALPAAPSHVREDP